MKSTTLAYTQKFHVPNRGTVYVIESPVTCSRDYFSFIEAMGSDHVLVDGVELKIRGFESFSVGRPISIGEKIGVLAY